MPLQKKRMEMIATWLMRLYALAHEDLRTAATAAQQEKQTQCSKKRWITAGYSVEVCRNALFVDPFF